MCREYHIGMALHFWASGFVSIHHDVDEYEREQGQADSDQGICCHSDDHGCLPLEAFLTCFEVNKTDRYGKAAVQHRFSALVDVGRQFVADDEAEGHATHCQKKKGFSEGVVAGQQLRKAGDVDVAHRDGVEQGQVTSGSPEYIRSRPA